MTPEIENPTEVSPRDLLGYSEIEIRAHVEALKGWRGIKADADALVNFFLDEDPAQDRPEYEGMCVYLEAITSALLKIDLGPIKESPSHHEAFTGWLMSFISTITCFADEPLLTAARSQALAAFYHSAKAATHQGRPLSKPEHLEGVEVQVLPAGGPKTAPFLPGSLEEGAVVRDFQYDPNTGSFRSDVNRKK